jgi:hypothetical protein
MANKGSMSDEKIISMLMRNKDKNFVQRILNPKIYPVLADEEAKRLAGPKGVSTHSMMDAESDGRFYVYPSVIQGNDGQLKRLNKEDSFRNAMDNGEAIEFPTQEEAGWFARNYKNIWKEKK